MKVETSHESDCNIKKIPFTYIGLSKSLFSEFWEPIRLKRHEIPVDERWVLENAPARNARGGSVRVLRCKVRRHGGVRDQGRGIAIQVAPVRDQGVC